MTLGSWSSSHDAVRPISLRRLRMKSAMSFSVVFPGTTTAGVNASARIASVFFTTARSFAISAGVFRLR